MKTDVADFRAMEKKYMKMTVKFKHKKTQTKPKPKLQKITKQK